MNFVILSFGLNPIGSDRIDSMFRIKIQCLIIKPVIFNKKDKSPSILLSIHLKHSMQKGKKTILHFTIQFNLFNLLVLCCFSFQMLIDVFENSIKNCTKKKKKSM